MWNIFMHKITVLQNLIYSLYPKPAKRKTTQKYLFLPLFGLIGDAVLFIDALHEYMKFAEEQKLKVIVGCRNQVAALYQAIGLDDKIVILDVDRKKMTASSKYFRETIDIVNSYDIDIIVHGRARHVIEDEFIYAISANKKIVLRNTDDKPQSIIKRFFYEHTYDVTLFPIESMDQYQRYGRVLHYLGNINYKSHISRIPELNSSLKIECKYVVLCPSSSQSEKCWPVDRFAEIGDYIYTRYKLKICFVGGKGDTKYSCGVIKRMKVHEAIIDFTGKTSMSEWIEILRGAVLVISNDSASVHLAASVQTPVICIAPQHDGYRFLPYMPDELYEDDVLPIPVRCEKVNCFDCQLTNDYKLAQSDSDCQISIKTKGCFKCIERIDVASVKKQIDKLLCL